MGNQILLHVAWSQSLVLKIVFTTLILAALYASLELLLSLLNPNSIRLLFSEFNTQTISCNLKIENTSCYVSLLLILSISS